MKNLLLVSLLIVLIASSVEAQVTWGKQTLKRGRLWATVWNSLQYGDPTETQNGFHTIDFPGYSKATDVSDALNYAEAVGYAIYGIRQNVASSYTINSRFFPSGQDIFPIEEATLTKNYNLANIGLAGEEIVSGAHHVNGLNVDIGRRSLVWSYPGLSDFIIHEVTITNNELTSVDSMYFGMRYGLRMTQRSGSRGDEKYGWDPIEKIFYFYDHQSFNFQDETPIVYNFGVGPERGDIGDARDIYQQGVREHELDAPGYFTVVVLDSAGANIFQNILEHTGQGLTEGADFVDQMFIQGSSSHARVKEVMTHQQPRMSWDSARVFGVEGGNKFERCPEFLVSVGPLTLTPFASVKLVFAEVMGEMDRAKIVEGGVSNIDLMATASRDTLLANVRRARNLFLNNYLPTVHPPPTPTDGENSLRITTEPGQIFIDWPPISPTYTDPILGINDFAGYRVYRSNYFTIGPWVLAKDINKDSVNIVDGFVRFVDKDLPFGVGNYYCVTSYDQDGNESGKVNNTRFPIYPLRAPNNEFPKNVFVVPNPFRQHSNLTGKGEQYRMEFIGIPAICKIKIYTLTGDLVQEIYHDDGSGSEAWGSIKRADYQLSKWTLGVAPGIYLFRVESLVAGHEGESFIGKFAIVK
ncbi:MAG: hypothetical protein HND40_03180 [Ignavibacteriota bacterium]|nr:hypothetical protein [Ignavibacteriota bacterium]MCO6446154.1 hypothetical protein [Ignavibacterium album]MCZ2267511.1 hypothetical protein [Ignavibacteriales bacterium]QKJ98633.1 MAG: hypothetical protein HND40_03180 [Ignavibacteriota bacterium]HOJ08077.1 hypothetical protein [Ignavibacteriaceae bacterium]